MSTADKEKIKTVEEDSNIKVVKTDEGQKDGQTKCPSCGSTDINLNEKTGHLQCNFCRHEFLPEKLDNLVEDITSIEGSVIASGSSDIDHSSETTITLKCQSCGAEVVIDTNEALQARCHWCRNTLSLNNQLPNGAIPDLVLGFKLPKNDAKASIEGFVKKRKFFAHPKFKKEFNVENIMGVYFPYMIIDGHGHALYKGEGEHLTRRYTVGSGDNKQIKYDAEAYTVERDFDIEIKNLTVESSSDRLDRNKNTNNIINSIMPFDIENCHRYDANYLKGYSSERRDLDVKNLESIVNSQLEDITKFSINDTLKHYDRGVAWATEKVDIKGKQWKSAYLPVWLYSYQQKKSGGKDLIHYVAVNARTGETMGSVPIYKPLLLFVAFLIALISYFIFIEIDFDGDIFIFASAPIFYFLMKGRYRNASARHKHELETDTKVKNLKKQDNFKEKRKGLTNPKITGANNELVKASTKVDGFFGSKFGMDEDKVTFAGKTIDLNEFKRKKEP